jgi:TetR/AcrR family transcriptional regulator, mexCD-oprJ operon repressor
VVTEPATDHRRATAERNTAAILDAAERLLARGAATSIVAVAAEANVSRVTVYGHFPAREDILEAVVERATRGAVAALDAAEPERGPPREALERLVAASWSELTRHLSSARAAAEQLSADAMRRAHEPILARVRALVERGRDAGEFRTDVPAEWQVATMLALGHAAADEVRAGRMNADAAGAALRLTLRAAMNPGAHPGH